MSCLPTRLSVFVCKFHSLVFFVLSLLSTSLFSADRSAFLKMRLKKKKGSARSIVPFRQTTGNNKRQTPLFVFLIEYGKVERNFLIYGGKSCSFVNTIADYISVYLIVHDYSFEVVLISWLRVWGRRYAYLIFSLFCRPFSLS